MYEQFYGLGARAFQLTPDPHFYFESASHKRALSYLGYGLNQGEGFIIVTGEVGAGKSTLVAHLMERIDPNTLTAAQIVTTALGAGELVHMVAEAFRLDVAGLDKPGVLAAIERFLQNEARAGRRCLLIVDECQNLDLPALEELRMLSNFQLGSHPLLQSLLLGQPEFRRTLAHHPGLEQLRQRIIASHHLDGLSDHEVEGYVSHRLRQVGWRGDYPRLGADLMAAIYRHTAGIPRRVNQAMNRLLLLGAVEERPELTCTMLDAVIAEMAADETRGAAAEPRPIVVASLPRADDTGNLAATARLGEMSALLAERDVRTAELEAAIRELQAAGGVSDADRATTSPDPALAASLAEIEARLEEQEQSLRHVLAMLIEWLEGDAARSAA
jgi:general secretion pathway protein A